MLNIIYLSFNVLSNLVCKMYNTDSQIYYEDSKNEKNT